MQIVTHLTICPFKTTFLRIISLVFVQNFLSTLSSSFVPQQTCQGCAVWGVYRVGVVDTTISQKQKINKVYRVISGKRVLGDIIGEMMRLVGKLNFSAQSGAAPRHSSSRCCYTSCALRWLEASGGHHHHARAGDCNSC